VEKPDRMDLGEFMTFEQEWAELRAASAARTGIVTVGGATFTVQQDAGTPPSVVTTATTPTSVSVTWTYAPTVHHYEVWRFSASGSSMMGSPTTKSFTDTTASPNTAYIYKVRAVAANGSMSGFASDYTHTYSLTDASLSGIPIRAVHVTELRSVINELRPLAGLPPISFTDPVLSGATAKRIHITELRDAIAELRSALLMPSYVFSSLAPDSAILAATTQEIRDALR